MESLAKECATPLGHMGLDIVGQRQEKVLTLYAGGTVCVDVSQIGWGFHQLTCHFFQALQAAVAFNASSRSTNGPAWAIVNSTGNIYQ